MKKSNERNYCYINFFIQDKVQTTLAWHFYEVQLESTVAYQGLN